MADGLILGLLASFLIISTRILSGFLFPFCINLIAGALYSQTNDTRFSAEVITDFTYGLYYNTFFSMLPTMYLGIFDQDILDRRLLQLPQLYNIGIRQLLYSSEKYWICIAEGLYQALVCYYVMYGTFSDSNMDPKGYEVGKDAMGTVLAYALIFVVNICAVVSLSMWTWWALFTIVLTLIIWVAYSIAYTFVGESYTFGLARTLYANPAIYLSVCFSITLSLLPRFTIKYIQQYIWPTDTDIIREEQKYRISESQPSFDKLGTKSSDDRLGHDHSGNQIDDVMSVQDDTVSVRSFKSTIVKPIERAGSSRRSRSEERLSSAGRQTNKRSKSIGPGELVDAKRSSSAAAKPMMTDGFGQSNDLLETGKLAFSGSVQGTTEGSSSADHPGSEREKSITSRLIGELRTRKTSVSSIIKENIQKASRFVQRIARQGTIKNAVGRQNRSSSIIFMGDRGFQTTNTGYAFSQDAGVGVTITQSLAPYVFFK